MNQPPPLPASRTGNSSYWIAAGLLLPAVFVSLFARSFLLPKMEQLWRYTEFDGSRLQPAMDLANGLLSFAPQCLGIFVFALVVLEICVPAWRRYRDRIVITVAILFNCAVLTGITTLAVVALIVVPRLAAIRH